MNLTRKQELKLIDIGLESVVSKALHTEPRARKVEKIKKLKWSRKQRTRFMKTMKSKWDKKRNNNE